MLEQAAQLFLSNFPTIVSFWTGLMLSWGIFIAIVLHRIIDFAALYNRGCREGDTAAAVFTWTANLLLFIYLFVVPGAVEKFSDAICVTNIFLTFMYTNYTVMLMRWSVAKQNYPTDPKTLLT